MIARIVRLANLCAWRRPSQDTTTVTNYQITAGPCWYPPGSYAEQLPHDCVFALAAHSLSPDHKKHTSSLYPSTRPALPAPTSTASTKETMRRLADARRLSTASSSTQQKP